MAKSGRALLAFVFLSGSTFGEKLPINELSPAERTLLYEQVRRSPGARQIGLSCAFFANVPMLTAASGIDIADGSPASKKFTASIYALRRGDFGFMSAFDREMFFEIFGINTAGVKFYYRDAPRSELLLDARERVTSDLASVLDKGKFASLRVIGEFGGPHNVLLLAHHKDRFFYHEPRTGRITSISTDELASKILCTSTIKGETKKKYFSSYHVVSLPAPRRKNPAILNLANLAEEQEIKLNAAQKKFISEKLVKADAKTGVVESYPGIDFAVSSRDFKSFINQALPVANM